MEYEPKCHLSEGEEHEYFLSSLYSKLIQNKVGVNIYISPPQPQAFGSLSQHFQLSLESPGSQSHPWPKPFNLPGLKSWAKSQEPLILVWNDRLKAQHQSSDGTEPCSHLAAPWIQQWRFPTSDTGWLLDSLWDKAEIVPSPAWHGKGLG